MSVTTLHRAQRLQPEPRNPNPIVRELFAIIRERQVTYESVEKAAGIGDGVLRSWARQDRPRLDLLMAAFGALGYELRVVAL